MTTKWNDRYALQFVNWIEKIYNNKIECNKKLCRIYSGNLITRAGCYKQAGWNFIWFFSKQAGSNKRQDMLENTDIFVIKKDSKQCITFRTQLNEQIP